MPDEVVERAASELAIRNLIAAVAHLADSGDPSEYVSCYADDAVWEMPANPHTGLPATRLAGAEQILAGVIERRAAGVQGPGTGTRHVVTTVRVEVDPSGAAASARSYWMLVGALDGGGFGVRTVGEYRDELRREGREWRLARRTIVVG